MGARDRDPGRGGAWERVGGSTPAGLAKDIFMNLINSSALPQSASPSSGLVEMKPNHPGRRQGRDSWSYSRRNRGRTSQPEGFEEGEDHGPGPLAPGKVPSSPPTAPGPSCNPEPSITLSRALTLSVLHGISDPVCLWVPDLSLDPSRHATALLPGHLWVSSRKPGVQSHLRPFSLEASVSPSAGWATGLGGKGCKRNG